MPQPTTRKLGLNVSAEMADRLKAISERTMIPQSRLLRQALELLFEKYPDPAQAPAGKPKRGSE